MTPRFLKKPPKIAQKMSPSEILLQLLQNLIVSFGLKFEINVGNCRNFCRCNYHVNFWQNFCCWDFRVNRSLEAVASEVFCSKDVLRNFTKSTGKHLCQSLFLNKVAGFRPFYNTFSYRTPPEAASGSWPIFLSALSHGHVDWAFLIFELC